MPTGVKIAATPEQLAGVKYDANGPDTANYVYPRRKADLNPLMHSRSGFDLAFNYRTDRLRFVWKWN